MPVEAQPLEERFWSKVRIGDGCWEWTAAIDHRGYGKIWVGSKRDGTWRMAAAHRVAWELANGPTGELHVLHQCDNPRCVRPSHLFLGTHGDNMRDCVEKGRHGTTRKPHRIARGERNSHAKLTADDVRAMRSSHARGEAISAIAREYGLSPQGARAAVLGLTWRHL